MSKTLTIVIENIPDGILEDTWKYAAKEAKNDFGGFVLEQTDHIKVDLTKVFLSEINIATELLGSAVAAHLVMTIPFDFSNQNP